MTPPDATRPEFHRPERVETIGEGKRSIAVAANAAERAALATRFGLIEIVRLNGDYLVARTPAGIVAEGRVTADVIQACFATGETLSARIDEQVALCFVADTPADPPAEEIELSLDALDIIPFDGGAIDLGEATAETMALALEPFPRSPNADAILRKAGVLAEEEAGPFGALAGLKAKLEEKKA